VVPGQGELVSSSGNDLIYTCPYESFPIETYKITATQSIKNLFASSTDNDELNFKVNIAACAEGFTNIPALGGPFTYTLGDVKLDIPLTGLANKECSYTLELTMFSGFFWTLPCSELPNQRFQKSVS
jgi:hypothetical protein